MDLPISVSLTLLLRTGDLLGAHLQDRFDRGSTHDVNQVVDCNLSLFNEFHHRK